MITSPDGEPVNVDWRLAEIRNRAMEAHLPQASSRKDFQPRKYSPHRKPLEDGDRP